jgi:RTX calcium-binding nonapeptide repeat (4 copies)
MDYFMLINTGIGIQVVGSSANVTIFHAEATEQLQVIGAAAMTSSTPPHPGGAATLTLDGGAGNDKLIGSQGNDVIIGGTGLDHIPGCLTRLPSMFRPRTIRLFLKKGRKFPCVLF